MGYATEASEALLAFGFDKLELHRVIATCDVGNASSARVLEKIGMRREAQFREDAWIRGVWRDSYLYAILEEEWRAVSREKNRWKYRRRWAKLWQPLGLGTLLTIAGAVAISNR